MIGRFIAYWIVILLLVKGWLPINEQLAVAVSTILFVQLAWTRVGNDISDSLTATGSKLRQDYLRELLSASDALEKQIASVEGCLNTLDSTAVLESYYKTWLAQYSGLWDRQLRLTAVTCMLDAKQEGVELEQRGSVRLNTELPQIALALLKTDKALLGQMRSIPRLSSLGLGAKGLAQVRGLNK
jgi:hypothetical protein